MKRWPVLALVLMLTVPVPVSTEDGGQPQQLHSYDSLFQSYMDYTNMTVLLHQMAENHSDIAKLMDLTAMTEYGTTWYGRTVWCMKISDNPDIMEDEPKLLIMGAHHAREWMSYEVPLYFMMHLLTQYGKEPTDNDGDGAVNEDPIDGTDNDGDGLVDEDWSEGRVTYLVNHREIYIVPMLNPDGVEYDRSVYPDHSWRKNLRDNNGNGVFDPSWDGVDLNRNYPWMWARNRYGQIIGPDGVTVCEDSSNPRSGMYHGPDDNHDDDGDARFPAPDWWNQHYTGDWNGIDEDPYDGIDNDGDGLVDEDKDGGFSEPETRSIEELMKLLDPDMDHTNGKSDVVISVSYHSFSELILWPWGYTEKHAPDHQLMRSIAETWSEINGYTPEQSSQLYPASGDSEDYLYGSHGVLAFTIEIDSSEDGGFHPPEEHILEAVNENLGVNLLAAEQLDLAKAAKRYGYDTINITPLQVVHTPGPAVAPEVPTGACAQSWRTVSTICLTASHCTTG